jgi:hypothetical protein
MPSLKKKSYHFKFDKWKLKQSPVAQLKIFAARRKTLKRSLAAKLKKNHAAQLKKSLVVQLKRRKLRTRKSVKTQK